MKPPITITCCSSPPRVDASGCGLFEIPKGTKNSKGRAIQNLLNLDAENRIMAFVRATALTDPDYNQSHYIVFATKNGVVKRTRLSEYSRPRANSVRAFNITEDDQQVGAILTEGDSEVILANSKAFPIRFNETQVRSMGRTATGVKGMTLSEGGRGDRHDLHESRNL